MNPFLASFPDNLPLEEELCQQIYATALRFAIRGIHVEVAPAQLNLTDLRKSIRRDGTDSYWPSLDFIRGFFQGVTLAVFRVVKTLYCDRLGRSIAMIARLLQALAQAACTHVLSYEVVWALCLFLENSRQTALAVHIERGQETWSMVSVKPKLSLQMEKSIVHNPVIISCIDLSRKQVLAFRITTQECEQETRHLILYDALIFHRRPHPRVATGLLWHLPQCLECDMASLETYMTLCQSMGVHVQAITQSAPFLASLQTVWESEFTGRVLHEAQCMLLFDTYFYKMYGYGPLRAQEQKEETYTGLRGYDQDPAWHFPFLRLLLPKSQQTITSEGLICYQGIHYTASWLQYWKNSQVTIRSSIFTEHMIWVYLDEEILCQAYTPQFTQMLSNNH